MSHYLDNYIYTFPSLYIHIVLHKYKINGYCELINRTVFVLLLTGRSVIT